MDLNNAEIAVTTQHLMDIKDYRDYWLHMSDYSDMGEFLSACSDLFPGEKEPEYRYPKWENIPDTLISREWLCPNFFEIRDARRGHGRRCPDIHGRIKLLLRHASIPLRNI